MKPNKLIRNQRTSNTFAEPDVEVNKTLKPTDKKNANTEIEKGEVVVTALNFDGLPELYKAAGKTHAGGGTPVRLTDSSFVFSNDKKMRLNKEELLKDFQKKPNNTGYTFAEIAGKYDINDYRKVLADPNSDDLQRKTAEFMISNMMKKLGKLALIQESEKGFPQGIPHISVPFITDSNFDMTQVYGTQGDESISDMDYAQTGGEANFDRVNLMKYGKYITDKSKRDEQIKNIAWNMMDDKWNPNDLYKTMGEMGGYGSERGGIAAKNDWGWDHKDIKKEDLDRYIQEYQGKSLAKKNFGGQMDFMQEGGTKKPTKKIKVTGIPAYDPEENVFLKTLDPSVTLSDDFVPKDQAGTKEGTFGKFDKKQADDNAKWYGKKVNWDNPEEVLTYQKAYNTHIYNKMITAGYSPKTAALTVNRVGFVPKKEGEELPNGLDGLAGKYTETRKDFNIPKNTTPSYKEDSKEVVNNLPAIKTNSVEFKPTKESAPFWLQDQINAAGAFMDMNRIKKYMPWQAPVNLTTATPTFYDPTRELAANSEAANIATTGVGMYSGAQNTSARASEIQGNALSNAANILGKYNNMNVGVANQFADQNNQIQNKQALLNADMANNLYKDTMIVNQQFDNAKTQAREKFRNTLTNALTNRAQTQSLNSMNEQYQVDPSSGGLVNFTKARNFDPENLVGQGQPKSLSSQVTALMGELPGLTYAEAIKLLTGK